MMMRYSACGILADGLGGRYSSANEVEPEVDLSPLDIRRVGHAEHDAVDTVRVADEVIVADVVAAGARELPDAQLAGA